MSKHNSTWKVPSFLQVCKNGGSLHGETGGVFLRQNMRFYLIDTSTESRHSDSGMFRHWHTDVTRTHQCSAHNEVLKFQVGMCSRMSRLCWRRYLLVHMVIHHLDGKSKMIEINCVADIHYVHRILRSYSNTWCLHFELSQQPSDIISHWFYHWIPICLANYDKALKMLH